MCTDQEVETKFKPSQSSYNQLIAEQCLCDLQECIPFFRIIEVLRQYDNYLSSNNEEQKSKTIWNIYRNFPIRYNNTSLLNDFNHLLFNHDHQFEWIYVILCYFRNKQTCNGDKCISLRRNCRDRSRISKQDNILQQLYAGDEVIEQQLVDRIHCYYFHSFDRGHRLIQRPEWHEPLSTSIESNESEDSKNESLLACLCQHRKQGKESKT